MESKPKLWLDIDDVVVSTSEFLKRRMISMFGEKWDSEENIWDLTPEMSSQEYLSGMVSGMLDYGDIPFVDGFLENLEEVRTMYDITLLSRCSFGSAERRVKEELGKMLNLPVVCLTNCEKKGLYAIGWVQVDDRLSELKDSFADVTILFNNDKTGCDGVWKYPTKNVRNWCDLTESLRYFKGRLYS